MFLKKSDKKQKNNWNIRKKIICRLLEIPRNEHKILEKNVNKRATQIQDGYIKISNFPI